MTLTIRLQIYNIFLKRKHFINIFYIPSFHAKPILIFLCGDQEGPCLITLLPSGGGKPPSKPPRGEERPPPNLPEGRLSKNQGYTLSPSGETEGGPCPQLGGDGGGSLFVNKINRIFLQEFLIVLEKRIVLRR